MLKHPGIDKEGLMRNLLSRFILLCFLVTSFVVPAHAVKINTPAPDFSLKDINGSSLSLSALKGQVVLLNFWSTTCPPCVSELPALNQLHSELGKGGLSVVGIAIDPSPKPVKELTIRLKLGFPVLLDSSKDVYFDSYGLFGQPVSLIIDRKGLVREKLVGAIEWTAPQVKNKINAYLKER